jgi:TetR/AcrR family transcriptional regulator, transcriptional repressor for nem operon
MPRQKEFDYDQKLAAARNLFWEKGYNATSMNDLVDALEINRSSLYLTYGSKHDLFLKSLNSYIQEKEQEYRKEAAKSAAPLKAVECVVRSVLKTVLCDNKTCLSLNSTFELARTDKDVKKLLKKQTLAAVGLLEGLLRQAKDSGELKTDKDPRVLAHFIVLGMSSIWNAHILFSDEKLTRQMTDLLMRNITC